MDAGAERGRREGGTRRDGGMTDVGGGVCLGKRGDRGGGAGGENG